MKNTILAGCAIVLFGIAGYVFLRPSGSKIRLANEYDYRGVCAACKSEIIAKYRKIDAEPYECPACHERAAFQWRYCGVCHKRTLPELAKPAEGGPKTVPAFPLCPVCRCFDLSPYDPDRPDQSPTGDNPLPRWP